MSKPKSVANFVLASLFMVGLHASASAQSSLTAKAGGMPTQPASPVAESDRIRDGLAGPVRRVRTEIAKLSSAAGRTTEEKRVVLEVASYDMKGAKTENQYFPVAGATLTGKEVYKYDEKGNISEMTVVNEQGSLLSKEIYKYDYDSVGNWTKMTTSVAMIEAGNVTFEPTEVTYRSITYYLDENMLKLAQPASASASPAVAPGNAANAMAKPAEIKSPSVAPSESKPQPISTSKAPVVVPSDTRTQANKSKTGAHKTAPALPNARTSFDTAGMNNTAAVKLGTAIDPAKVPVVVMGSEPPPPPSPKPILKPVSGGALNGRATSLPPPTYPDQAKRARLSGIVTVEVVVDEQGKVISAQATTGPGILREAAVQAALRAKFSPTLLSGQPVKVSGSINYKFSLQ